MDASTHKRQGPGSSDDVSVARVRGELRYWLELARLMVDRRFLFPRRAEAGLPVLLIPGFMAGDVSMTALAGWLRRRGHEVHGSGMLFNAGCAGRELSRLEKKLTAFDGPAIVIGQSRGGTLARALAAGHPESVAGLVTLGSPVLDPLAVSASVMRTVRSLARLGDLGMPGVFSSDCADGPCCADFYSRLREPLEPSLLALAVYSRTDGIVDYRACLDPWATCVEIEGSHCGMAVNPATYPQLEILLRRTEEAACRQ